MFDFHADFIETEISLLNCYELKPITTKLIEKIAYLYIQLFNF